MKVTAETTSYRVNFTDPLSGKVKKVGLPLFGTIKEKKLQVKELQAYINTLKLQAKKMEAKQLILEIEATKRSRLQHDATFVLKVKNYRSQRHQKISELFQEYMKTDAYKQVSVKVQYQRQKHFAIFADYLSNQGIIYKDQINAQSVANFMNQLEGKASTFNKYYANLSNILKAVDITDMFTSIKRKNAEADTQTKMPFTEKEVELIIKNFSGEWKKIVLTAAHTGLRFVDCVHLKKEHIINDYHGTPIIKIVPSKTSHTGRALYIKITKPIHFLLTDKPTKNGYFFPERVKMYQAGTAHAGASLNHVFTKKLKSLGIFNKGFHSFRHYFVDKLRLCGLTNEQIGSIVGHSSVKQTRDYGDFHHVIDLEKIL